MEDVTFIIRIEDEYENLKKRVGTLKSFIKTDRFQIINEVQQKLLKEQLVVMKEYLKILKERLENLDKNRNDG